MLTTSVEPAQQFCHDFLLTSFSRPGPPYPIPRSPDTTSVVLARCQDGGSQIFGQQNLPCETTQGSGTVLRVRRCTPEGRLTRERWLSAKGYTQRRIVLRLAAEAFKPRGRKWNVTTVARALGRGAAGSSKVGSRVDVAAELIDSADAMSEPLAFNLKGERVAPDRELTRTRARLRELAAAGGGGRALLFLHCALGDSQIDSARVVNRLHKVVV
jgi:hypothetical protein